jgi:3-phenylpropionate/cinnamic acid dioxygenase small subunit
VYQVRRDRTGTAFVGRREDHLRRQAGEWKIARRTILLAQSVLPRTLSLFF